MVRKVGGTSRIPPKQATGSVYNPKGKQGRNNKISNSSKPIAGASKTRVPGKNRTNPKISNVRSTKSTSLSSWRNRLKTSVRKSEAGVPQAAVHKNAMSPGDLAKQTALSGAKGIRSGEQSPKVAAGTDEVDEEDEDKAVTTDVDYVTNSGGDSENGSYNDTFFSDSDPESEKMDYEVATSEVDEDDASEPRHLEDDEDTAERRASSEYASTEKASNRPGKTGKRLTGSSSLRHATRGKSEYNFPQSKPPQSPMFQNNGNKQLLFQKLWQDLTQLQNDSNGATEALAKKTKKIRALQAKNVDIEHRHQQDKRRIERLLHRIAALEKANVGVTTQMQFAQNQLESERKSHSKFVEESNVMRERSKQDFESLSVKLQEHQEKVQTLTTQLDSMKLAEEEHSRKESELEHKLSVAQQRHDDERERSDKTISLMKSEVERLSLQKEEVSRHLWHASDELKTMKEQLKLAQVELEQLDGVHKGSLTEHAKVLEELEEQRRAMESAKDEVIQLKKLAQGGEEKWKSQAKDLKQQIKNLENLIQEKEGVEKKFADSEEELKSTIEDLEGKLVKNKEEASAHADSLTKAASVLQENHLKEVMSMESKLAKAVETETKAIESLKKMEDESKEARKLHKLSASQYKQEKQKTKVLESEIVQLKGEVVKLKASLEEHVSARSRTEAALNALQGVRDRDIKAMKEELEKATGKQREDYGEQLKKIESLQTALSEREDTIKEINQRLQDASRDLETIKGNYKSSKEGWLKLQNELEEQLKEAQKTATGLQANRSKELETTQEKLATVKERLETETKEKQQLLEDCRRMNNQIKETVNERKRMKEAVQNAQASAVKLSSQLDSTKEELHALQVQLTEEQSKAKLNAQEHIAARKDLRELIDELKNELKQTKKTAAVQVTAFQEKVERQKDEFEELQKRKLELEEKQLVLEKKIHEKEKCCESIEQELRDLQQKFDSESITMNNELEAALTKVREREQQLRELEAAQANGNHLEHKVKELKTQILERDRMLNETKKELIQTREMVSEEQEKVNGLRKEIAVRKQDYQNVTSDLATVKADRSGLEREYRVREARLNKELSEARHIIQSKTGELDRSRMLLEQLQHKFEKVQESANNTVKKLMSEAQESEKQCAEDLALLRSELREQGNRFLDLQNTRSKETASFRAQKAMMDEQLGALQRKFDALKAEKEEAIQEAERRQGQLDVTNGELEALQEVVQGLERRLGQEEGTISSLEAQLTEERAAKATLKKQLKEEEAGLRMQLEHEREAANKLRADLNTATREMEWAQNESNIKQSALVRQVGNLRGDLQRKGEDLTATEAKLHQVQEEIQLLHAATSKQVAQLKDDNRLSYESRTKEVENSKRELQALAAKVAQLESELDVSNSKVRDLQLKLDQQAEEAAAYSRNSSDLARRAKVLDSNKRKLEAEVKKLRRQLSSAPTPTEGPNDSMEHIAAMERTHEEEVARLRNQINSLRQQVSGFEDEATRRGQDGDRGDLQAANHSRRTSEQRLRAVEHVAEMYFKESNKGNAGGERSTRRDEYPANASTAPAESLDVPSSRGSGASGESSGSDRSLDTMRRASEFLERKRNSRSETQVSKTGLLPNNMTLAEADKAAAALEGSARDIQQRLAGNVSRSSLVPLETPKMEATRSRPSTSSSSASGKLPYVHQK